jgi:hypothetical protein
MTMSGAKKGGGYHSAKTGKFVTKKYAESKEGKGKTTYVSNKK